MHMYSSGQKNVLSLFHFIKQLSQHTYVNQNHTCACQNDMNTKHLVNTESKVGEVFLYFLFFIV